MFVKRVVRAPYICTVPGGGVRAILCWPDAKTLIVEGKKVGYSVKDQTAIVPLDVSGTDINNIKMAIFRMGSQKKVVNKTK